MDDIFWRDLRIYVEASLMEAQKREKEGYITNYSLLIDIIGKQVERYVVSFLLSKVMNS